MRPSTISRALPALLPALTLLLAGCLAPRPVTTLEDAVISGRAVWSGEVRVRGVVTVKKTGHLTIRPGTRVVFEPLDRDDDGIGDSELLVEGGLVAAGTAKHPILFTSGASQPAPADWKYLYLDFAREARLAHVISEYAFSGVQVHFCKARIVDSEFRRNVDGVRFSTVNIELAGNRIHHNTHGVRYEERRSTGRVHHNTIADNAIGIFAVTRCTGGVRFDRNNLAHNRDYHVKLGLRQQADLSYPHNWWGTEDPARIAEGFFDQRYDPALGRVSAPRPLPGPVPLSDWSTQGVQP